MSADVKAHPAISEEDRLRADLYGFLANVLLSAPNQDRLDQYSRLEGDGSPLGQAFVTCSKISAVTTPSEVSAEYEALFIGLGRGELVPYGSYYLTGFLNEKPLAKLRNAMRDMGVERRAGVSEPEDHIGSLMEMMAGLIVGRYGRDTDLAGQQEFFNIHIASWATPFFTDLEAAEGSKFYQPVGAIGRIFMEIEATAFAMQ